MYYVYKHLAITELHPQAALASEAARCAGDQGKYWEMHAELFKAPSAWDTTADTARATFGRYAKQLGLDMGGFDACMSEGRQRPAVETNRAEAQRLGLTGTPAFVINGKLLAGAQPYTVFQRALDRELKSIAGTKP